MNTHEPIHSHPATPTPMRILDALLKRPQALLDELRTGTSAAPAWWLLAIALLCTASYGVLVGSLSGGAQMLVAPAKVSLGTLGAMLICLPSLYIFAALAGMEAGLRTLTGALFGAVCLASVVLIGFAPVAWIFSQSTDSIAFIGALHLGFWAIGMGFGLRFLRRLGAASGQRPGIHTRIWTFIFVLVCLQMMTTLRPIVGTASTFFPKEKKFLWRTGFRYSAGRAPSRRHH
jgi:hypothetical protein